LEYFYPQADIFIRGFAENALLVDLVQTDYDKSKPIAGVHFVGKTQIGRR